MKAYYLDDGIILDGELNVKNMIFIPESFACGFSSLKIFDKDIGVKLFLKRDKAEYAKSVYEYKEHLKTLEKEIYGSSPVKLMCKFLDWISEKLR